MASQFNNKPLGDQGDQVYYIGGEISSTDTDKYTKDLIHKYLKIGSLYTIESINKNLTVFCDHYYFVEESTEGYCFPCNQFSSLIPKDYIRKKYNLK